MQLRLNPPPNKALQLTGRRCGACQVASAVLPTVFILLVVAPSFVPTAPAPNVLVYGLLGGWLLCGIARAALSHRFSELERGVVAFWARAFLLFLLTTTVLGALPLLVLPAFGTSLGWPLVTSSVYLRSISLLVLLVSGLVVFALWRRHWSALLANPEPARGRAA